MYNLNEIVAAATECKETMCKVKTVQDVIDLRKVGITEKEIEMVDIGNEFEEVNLHEVEPTTPVYGLMLRYYSADSGVDIMSPTMCYGDEILFHFDVWEMMPEGYDSYLAIEETTLDTITEEYKEYVSEHCIHVVDIDWSVAEGDYIPADDMYVPKDVEHIPSYLTKVTGVLVDDYLIEKSFVGGLAQYDSRNGDSDLNKYSGQIVEVIRPLTKDEADIDEVGKMYKVKFSDGTEADVFDDELSSDGTEQNDDPKVYHLIRILRDEKIDELREHLQMNDYTDVEFVIDENSSIATLLVPETEYYEVITIIEDRGIKYFVVSW